MSDQKSTLDLALIQSHLHWEDPEANFKHLGQQIEACPTADLILLPEMFTTGFTMQPKELGEQSEGPTLAWLRAWAQKKDAAISGSIIVQEEEEYYNRLYFVFPDGDYRTYNKRHLFSLAGEEKVYTPGRAPLFVHYKGWHINPQICFDLRFPVWCRNTRSVDLQFFVANWPARRAYAWQTLLPARAIENLCYVAGLNRVGADGNGVEHSGDSAVYDALGKKIRALTPNQEGIAVIRLEKGHLEETRQRFSFLEDRDQFTLSY